MGSAADFDTDVLVVGGGPAGLAAAIAARRKGFRAMVADSQRPPIDKACGEGLGPDAVTAAEALGISIPQQNAYRAKGIRFISDAGRAEARFPSGPALGVRRTVLHRELVAHANRCGVMLLWGTGVTGICGNEAVLSTGKLRARWIIGADGERSRVRAWAGLDGKFLRRKRFAFRQHYRIAPWTDFIEIYWERGFQVYVTPVAVDEIGIACVSYDAHLRVDRALAAFPDLCRRIADAEICSTERGALSSTRRLPAVYKGAIALVGDASGSVDVITGQGLGVAFQQAAALAEAMERNDLAYYQSEHRRIALRPALNGEVLLAMDRWPWLGSRTRAALGRNQDLFERMIAFHLDAIASPWQEAATLARLGWSVLLG